MPVHVYETLAARYFGNLTCVAARGLATISRPTHRFVRQDSERTPHLFLRSSWTTGAHDRSTNSVLLAGNPVADVRAAVEQISTVIAAGAPFFAKRASSPTLS